MTLVICGDSTAAAYASAQHPQAGWGQLVQRFLRPGARVVDLAQCGRSSRSYVDEGWLRVAGAELAAGDLLLVQFGHNDEKPDAARHTEPHTSFPEHLTLFIDVARSRAAVPVLLSPVSRRVFDPSGCLVDTHGGYPRAVQELAAASGVPFVDLHARSRALIESLGPEDSKRMFLWVSHGDYPGYPDGAADDSHFCETGAVAIARIVLSGILETGAGNLLSGHIALDAVV